MLRSNKKKSELFNKLIQIIRCEIFKITILNLKEVQLDENAITLDALRAIEAIHQQGSFAGAAKVLFKVPSALTYTIAKLESDLNVALFV